MVDAPGWLFRGPPVRASGPERDKKIHGEVNLSDSKAMQKIKAAKEEILELIY